MVAESGPAVWFQLVEVFADVLKAVAWPFVVFFVALIFSKDVKALLPRINKLGPSGVELESLNKQKSLPKVSSEENFAKRELDEIRDPVAKRFEEENFRALNSLEIDDQFDLEKILVRSLTLQQLQKHLAIIYANIFGSQIRALKELNIAPISRAKAATMYSEVKEEEPALKDWDLDEYLNYLFAWDLIEFDEEHGEFRITETGKSFLHFLVLSGLSENRVN